MKKFLWTLPLVCFLPLLVGCGGSGGGGSSGGGGGQVNQTTGTGEDDSGGNTLVQNPSPPIPPIQTPPVVTIPDSDPPLVQDTPEEVEEKKFAALVTRTRAAAAAVKFQIQRPTEADIASFPIIKSKEFKDSAYWTNKNDKNYILSFRVSREYKGNKFVYDVLGLSEVYARNITGKYMSGISQGEPVKIGVWDSGITKSALNYRISREKHHDTLKTRVTGVSVENMNENGDTIDKDVKLSDKDTLLRGTVIAALIAAGKDYSIDRGGDYEGIHGVAYDATLFSVAQKLSIGTRDIDTRDNAGKTIDLEKVVKRFVKEGVKVLNISFNDQNAPPIAGGPDWFTPSMIKSLKDADIVTVMTAGQVSRNEPWYPGTKAYGAGMKGYGLVIVEATADNKKDRKNGEEFIKQTDVTDKIFLGKPPDVIINGVSHSYSGSNSAACGEEWKYCLTVITQWFGSGSPGSSAGLQSPRAYLAQDKKGDSITERKTNDSPVVTGAGAALASGAVALLRGAYPTLKGNEIVALLLDSAIKPPKDTLLADKEQWRAKFGRGILSVKEALKQSFEAAVPAQTASSYEATGFSLSAGGVRVAPSLGALPLLKPLKGNTPLQILFFDKFRDPNRYWVQDINDTFLSFASRGEEKPVLSFFSSVSSTLKAEVDKGRLLLNKEEGKMAYEGVLGEVPYRVGIGGEILEEEDRVLALASHGDLLEEKRSFSLGSGFYLGFAQGEKEGYRVYSGYRKTFGSGFLYGEAGIVREGEAFLGGRGTAFMEFSNGGRTWYGRIQGRMRVGGFEMNVAAYMGRSFSGGEGSRSSWLRLKEGRSQSGGISIKRGLSRKRSIELGALFPLKSSYVGEMSQLEVLKGDLLGTLRWSQHDVRLSSEGREKLFYGSYTQVVKTGGKIHLSFGVRLQRNHVPNRVPESFYLLQYRRAF